MYLVSGTFKGKALKREQMSFTEVAELFDASDILKRKDVEFKIVPERMVRDKRNGGYRTNEVITSPCKFSGRYNGAQVEIIYYEQENVQGEGPTAKIKRTPKKLRFNGPTMPMNIEEKEKLLFFFLHPHCRNSPLNNGKEAFYELYMPEVKAAKEMLDIDNTLEMANLVRNSDNMGLLRRKAKGLNLRIGREVVNIPNVMKMSDEEVKTALIKVAMQYPQQFKKAFEDENTDFEGALRDAIDFGVISMKVVAGTKAFYWNEQNGGAMICRVGDGVEAWKALKQYVVSHFQAIFPRLQTALAATDAGQLMEQMRQSEIMQRLKIEGKPDNAITNLDSLTPENLFNVALDKEIFYFDRSLEKVFWLEEGELGKAFFDVVDMKNWKKDLTYKFGVDKELRADLIQRIKSQLE